ncbi:hypothetical protein GQ457_01G047330 [Hibiscus cannabinus]
MKYVETTIAVINCIGAPVCKYLGYHRNHDDYVRKFKSIRDELKCKTEDMELQLKAELLHPLGKIPKKGVQNWLEKTKTVIVEAQGVENKVCNGRYLCRARNGKLVEEKTVEMQTLLDKAPNASESLVIDGPNVGFPLPTSELVGEKTVRDEIWKCLMEEEVCKIGVWGMGGVGKTTVMKHIHNDLLKESRFDKVIWVTISKDFNVVKLQDAIASALNLNGYLAEKSDEVIRAVILLAMLKRTGKHVLILDDVWDEFSLEEVGIPEPSNSNGCKMVLTTRSKQVCNRMGCKEMLVRPLSKEEALILFLSRVGPNTVQNKTIMPTLELVVNECDGLPLTIFVVAGCLKGENDPIIWKNALKELKRQTWMVKEVEDKVIERLKFSFDHLKDDEVKHCFLYCALYPEDFEILKDELIECWIDEGLIDEMDSRQDMEDKGHVILKKLKDNCLLEDATSDWPRVKMHDALRDMALSITSTNPRYMIQAGMQLKKLPKEEEWRADIEKVSLMRNSISEIPEDMLAPNCQLLTTLLLQHNRIKKIPDSFFANMPRLRVLNLSCTSIESLPDSISELEELTTLLLHDCGRLRHVPRLSKLRGLKKLDLRWTIIEKVPQGMENLVDLRYLDLCCTYLKDIPAGVLSKLSRLQHLKINLGDTEARVEEVMTLQNLECFEWYFQDSSELNKFVSAMQRSKKNLIRYALQLGQRHMGGRINDKIVKIWGYRFCEGELIRLPLDIQDLFINACQDLTSLSDYIPCLENAIDLRLCTIVNCHDIKYIVSLPPSSSSSSTHPFQSLERLDLYNLPDLREVIKVERFRLLLPSAIFSLLKVIDIRDCWSMKTLLPHWLLPNLQNLEEISVDRCDDLIQVLGEDDEENGSDASIKFSLPKLRELRLYSLPELENICGRRGVMVCDSLRLIYVYGCSKLKRIPPFAPLVGNGQPYAYAPPSLQIKSSPESWWESLEWDHHPNYKNLLQPHFIDHYFRNR